MVTYALGGQTQVEGVLLFVALGGIGVGMVSWSKRFMTTAPETEPRPRLASTEDEIAGVLRRLRPGEYQLERRAPAHEAAPRRARRARARRAVPDRVARATGPARASGCRPTKKGTRLVTEEGDPVRADQRQRQRRDHRVPRGRRRRRVLPGRCSSASIPTCTFTARPGREDWTPQNLAAFSKVCTHAGCPVGLYQNERRELLCPCHQSTFDVYDAARPVFGPAATSLPQLPLDVDDDGYVIAAGDFSGPPGPGLLEPEVALGGKRLR